MAARHGAPPQSPAGAPEQPNSNSAPEPAHQFPLDRIEANVPHPDTPAASLPWNAATHSCGAWWTGASRAHCPACHRTFSCDSAADLHRQGRFGIDRRCVDPAEVGLQAKRMPWGVMWQHPGPEPGRDTRRTLAIANTPAEVAS